MTTVQIRPAMLDDLPGIDAIYNHYVAHSTCTYQETPDSPVERQRWLSDRDGTLHPVIVALDSDRVVGFGSLSPFHRRSGYRKAVENAVYVHPEFHGRGIGSRLLQDLIDRGRKAGHHTIIALIDAEQPGSLALHARFGFQHAGTLREAGYKFGRWLHVQYYQLLL